MTKESETFFSRTLERKTAEAREAVYGCIKRYLAPDSKGRQAAAQAAFGAVDRIVQLLHPNDHPPWLMALHAALRDAENNSGNANGVAAVQRIACELYPQLQQHQWTVGASESASGFDFDAIYEKYRSEYRIPELFDELVKYLKDIVASGAIDSVRALRELNKIIVTLHAARKGSYFATRGAWYFVVMWFKNTGWELLGSIAGIGPAVKGLQKTLEETNGQMKDLHESIQGDLEKQITSDFPRLEYQPPAIPRIEGPKNGDVDTSPEAGT